MHPGRLPEDWLGAVVSIAQGAGAAIRAIYARPFEIHEKDDRSPLTEADLAAHHLIISELKRLDPSLPILSEESVDAFPGPDGAGRYWLVDPLDGTKEFIRRNGEFTVNIALIEGGRPVLGVVHAPVPDTVYAATAGRSALKYAPGRAPVTLTACRHEDGTPWRVVGSRSHPGESLGMMLSRLESFTMVPMGSSLKFCLVAEGAADLYPRLGPTSLWDTAAAQCVVEAAGGAVIQLNGQPLRYADPQQILNPFFIAHGKTPPPWLARPAD